MESGKYTLGYKTVLKSFRNWKGKLIIIAKCCPPHRKSEIECYSMLAKVGVHHYNGNNNVDLGTSSGKYFRVCCLIIIHPAIAFGTVLHVISTSVLGITPILHDINGTRDTGPET
ncbi:hypothetical protein SAY86_008773 [Trapa natans]|uniref:Ribosomal protein eL8/eL30/eS12/Gadd45 domain-containing protein n=1 Tax=Trapa natans TaxID=22666 RepID=A0AAN7K964_TRANT|nr:hypothetical protein SAY86_008773 [Trapa natans]